MIRVLTYIALLVAITAGSLLAYRNQPYSIRLEHEAQSSKGQDKPYVCTDRQAEAGECLPLVKPTPTPTPVPFGPVPNVLQPTPMMVTPEVVPLPTPRPVEIAHVKKKKKVVKKKSAAAKLKTKWVEPPAKPFSLGDLFNVR